MHRGKSRSEQILTRTRASCVVCPLTCGRRTRSNDKSRRDAWRGGPVRGVVARDLHLGDRPGVSRKHGNATAMPLPLCRLHSAAMSLPVLFLVCTWRSTHLTREITTLPEPSNPHWKCNPEDTKTQQTRAISLEPTPPIVIPTRAKTQNALPPKSIHILARPAVNEPHDITEEESPSNDARAPHLSPQSSTARQTTRKARGISRRAPKS